jgi:hypothetical protein
MQYGHDMLHGFDMQHRHAACICNMNMQRGHAARTCSMDMQHEYAAWICSMNMQHGYAAWTSSRNVEWICSINMQVSISKTCRMDVQHGQICSMDISIDMRMQRRHTANAA